MNQLKDYFHFQKEERIAFFFLVAVIVGIIVYMQVDKNSTAVDADADFSAFEQKVADFENAISIEENKEETENSLDSEEEETPAVVLKPFDPNGLPLESWIAMGLSTAQAEVIKNYEEKGGKFYSKEDVKKMYSITDTKFKELEPYIVIEKAKKPLSTEKNEWKKPYLEEEEAIFFDLNIIDSLDLLKVSGIGPAFASRIIKFRKAAGGFETKKQLLDVWGMDDERYKKIEESFFVDSSFSLRKININTATAAELKEHPYISWNVANSIEKYRIQNGRFKKLEEIKQSHLINDSLFQKLQPYLKLSSNHGRRN